MITVTRTKTVSYEPYVTETTTTVEHVGKTLAVWVNDNYRIMSDVYGYSFNALVWNEAAATPEHVTVDVGECGVNTDLAKVDATDEVFAAYREFLFKNELASRKAEADRVAKTINKGTIVKVVSGKTGKGSVGKVFAILNKSYGMGYRSNVEHKLGVALDDEMHEVAGKYGKTFKAYKNAIWVWERNVEVVNFNPNYSNCEAEAAAIVDRRIAETKKGKSPWA